MNQSQFINLICVFTIFILGSVFYFSVENESKNSKLPTSGGIYMTNVRTEKELVVVYSCQNDSVTVILHKKAIENIFIYQILSLYLYSNQ